jgi:hypothetical protein
MAKRKHKKREISTLEDAIQEHGPLLSDPPVPTPSQPTENRPLPLSLADIRTETLRQHSNVAHTIADLEAWAAEIAATIAFLKERGR